MTLQGVIEAISPGTIWLILFTTWLFVLICPRKAFPWMLALLIPFWCCSWWLIYRPVPTHSDWAWFGQGLLIWALIFALVAMFIRRQVARFIERRLPDLDELNWRPARLSALGAVLGTLILELGPAIAHATSALAALTLIALGFFGSAVLAWLAKSRTARRDVAATSAFVFALGIVLIAIWPFEVCRAAARYAQESPYCILVADGDKNERLARSRLELSPLIMRANEYGTLALNRHAYIVMENGGHAYWSYMQSEFVDELSSSHAADQLYPDKRCQPELSFIEKLPWF